MAGINLINNLKALISVRVPVETIIPTNEKLKFDSKNNDSKSNYSHSSGNNNNNNNNNEQKYDYDNDNNNDDKNNSNNNNKKFFNNNNNDQKLWLRLNSIHSRFAKLAFCNYG